MRRYICSVCGFEYDPEKGIPQAGIAPGTPFEDLPDGFECPLCGASKNAFAPQEDLRKKLAPPSVQITTEVQRLIFRTPTTISLRLALPSYTPFKPGQHLTITLTPKADVSPAELTRTLSISNSPTEQGYLEVTKRITQSIFSKMFSTTQPGNKVIVNYPMGQFTFEGEYPKIALLSGGIGITPLRSICKNIVDQKLGTDTCLIYSNRTENEIIFWEDLKGMASSTPSLRVVHTLSRSQTNWPGRQGRITGDVIRSEVPDYQDRYFFLCGPTQMVEELSTILEEELLLPAQQIRTENFKGY